LSYLEARQTRTQ